jgi:hypothetical protein
LSLVLILIPEFQHTHLPPKCCKLRNIPQFLLLMFSFSNSHLSLSRSVGVHHLCYICNFTFHLVIAKPNNKRNMGMITLLKLGIHVNCHWFWNYDNGHIQTFDYTSMFIWHEDIFFHYFIILITTTILLENPNFHNYTKTHYRWQNATTKPTPKFGKCDHAKI